MSKRQIIILIGVWVAVFLFLGFPSGWHKVLAIATGLILILVAYSLKAETSPVSSDQVPYVEHKSNTSQPTHQSASQSVSSSTPDSSITSDKKLM